MTNHRDTPDHPQAGRIIAVSALLRAGHTPQQVSAALKAIDEGKDLGDVWKALKDGRR